jgi:hypothetical protein
MRRDRGVCPKADGTTQRVKGEDMKHISIIIGMCLVAVVSFSAIAAASAFAEEPMPYLMLFSKGDPNEGGTFTSTGATKDIFQTKESTFECENSTNTGEFEKELGRHLGKVTVVLKKCKASGFNCGNEGSSENVTLLKWLWHLVAGFDPRLNRWIPALLLLIGASKENHESTGEFEFTCAGIVKIRVKGKSLTGALYKTGTETPLELGESLEKADLVLQGESPKSLKLLFSKVFFPLQKTEETESTFEAETSLTKKLEPAEIIARDTLEKIENAKKEKVSVELAE